MFTPPASFPHAILRMAIHSDDQTLKDKFTESVIKHNHKMKEPCPDSGFDIFTPEDTVFDRSYDTTMINMQVSFEMSPYNVVTGKYEDCCGFYSYPRSSISKTPLILANHVGVIDSGYRGTLRGAFRMLPTSNVNDAQNERALYTVEKFNRLLQVCHPSLCPLFIEIVTPEQLSVSSRGIGGFGSTGV